MDANLPADTGRASQPHRVEQHGGKSKVSELTFVEKSDSGVPFIVKTLMECNAAMTTVGIGGQDRVDVCGMARIRTHLCHVSCLPPLLVCFRSSIIGMTLCPYRLRPCT